MAFKINISEKGKSWKLEIEADSLVGKSISDKVDGKEIKPELEEYEFEITGGSDNAGFPISKNVEGLGLKRLLLSKGWGMHDSREGVRLRKTVRGKQISAAISQINMKVIKSGKKIMEEIFPDQNKKKEPKPVQVAVPTQ